MTAYQAAASTLGQENRAERGEALTYYYRGDPARTAGSRHFRGPQDEPFSPSMAESSAERKRRKLARLAELDAVDPPLSQAEICRRLEVSPKTLRSYRREAGSS